MAVGRESTIGGGQKEGEQAGQSLGLGENLCLGLEPPRGNRRKWRGPEVLGGKHGQRAGVKAGAGKEGSDGVGLMGDAESQPGL